MKSGLLPKITIPSIEEQFQLYRTAYKPYNQVFFDVETPIPGLIPLLLIAFNFVRDHLPISLVNTLMEFWQEAKRDIDLNQVTISRFKSHNLRLAFLLAQGQKRGLYTQRLSILVHLLEEDRWKKLENYTPAPGSFILQAQIYPFCFEAILYDCKGRLTYDQFLASILNPELVLGISAFPIVGLGPHGDYVSDSASFLAHDFVHWSIFSGQFYNLEGDVWLRLKTLLRGIYDQHRNSTIVQIGLFFLLHEVSLSIEDLFDNSRGAVTDFIILERCIEYAKEEAQKSIEAVEGPIGAFLEKFRFQNELLSNPCIHSARRIGENLYAVSLGLYSRNTHQIILVSGCIHFRETEDPHFEHLTLNNVQITNPDILTEEMKRDILQTLEGGNGRVISRSVAYQAQVPDLLKMINYAYGDKVLTSQSSGQEIYQQFQRLWKDFMDLANTKNRVLQLSALS